MEEISDWFKRFLSVFSRTPIKKCFRCGEILEFLVNPETDEINMFHKDGPERFCQECKISQ